MNNRSLAIEISKHPLIKKLLEGKLATSSEVARLVVEELLLTEEISDENWKHTLTLTDDRLIEYFSDPEKLKNLIDSFKQQQQHGEGSALAPDEAVRIQNLIKELAPKTDLSSSVSREELANAVNKATEYFQDSVSYFAGKDIPLEDILQVAIKTQLTGNPQAKHTEESLKASADKMIGNYKGDFKEFIRNAAVFNLGKFTKDSEKYESYLGSLRKALDAHASTNKPEEPLSDAVANAKAQISDAAFFKDDLPPNAHVPFYELFILLKEQPLQENREFFNAEEFLNQKGFPFKKYKEALKKLGDEKSKIISAVFKNEEKVRQFAELFGVDSEEPTKAEEIVQDIAKEVKEEDPNIEDEDDKIIDNVVKNEIEKMPELVDQPPKVKEKIKDEVINVLKGEETTKIDTTKIDALRTAYKEFNEEFFRKRFLYEQGTIIKALMKALRDVVKKEDRAASIPGPSNIREGEEEVQVEERDLRNIQTAFRVLLENIREAKKRLALFKKAAGAGKIISSDYKRDLIETIQEIQDFIHELTSEINNLLPKKSKTLSEAEEEDKEPAPFQDVVDTHRNVKALLGNILAAENDEELSKNLSTKIEEILNSLQDITHHFPSVNPFKTKNVDFNSMEEQFTGAVKNVKPALFAVVDMVKTKTAQDIVLKKVIRKMEEFSGSIKNIFDIESKFKDIASQQPAENEVAIDYDGTETTKPPISLDKEKDEEEEKEDNNTEEEEQGAISKGLEKIKQFFSSFAKKNDYSYKDFMSSNFTDNGKPLFSEQELEVINKFIDLLLKPGPITEAIGLKYEQTFQEELGISPKKIRSVFASLSTEEQQTLTQALVQRRDGANLKTKKELLARMIKVKKKAKEILTQDEEQTTDLLADLNNTPEKLALKLNVEKEEVPDIVMQVNLELDKQKLSSKETESTEEEEELEQEAPALESFTSIIEKMEGIEGVDLESAIEDTDKLEKIKSLLKDLNALLKKFKEAGTPLMYDAIEESRSEVTSFEWEGGFYFTTVEEEGGYFFRGLDRFEIQKKEQEKEKLQEQIANKLKPLIWETIRKNK